MPTTEPEAPIPPHVWRSILLVMEKLAASSDLEAVLHLIIDATRDALNADRATVFQYDRERHELVATHAHGINGSADGSPTAHAREVGGTEGVGGVGGVRLSADLGLAGQAIRTKCIINVPDCYADPRFNPEIDRRTGYRTNCMLTIPLVSFDGVLEGVAQVLNKRAPGPPADSGPAISISPHSAAPPRFDATDESIARALASQAAVAIRRARLIQAERRKEKIEADLRIAREMQRSALPRSIPAVPGYSIAAANIQAEETGGDTYDLCTTADGGLLILMADATGHGIGPALSATQVQSMLRMAARLGAPLQNTLVQLNSLIAAALPPGRFVTAFIGVLDPATHLLRYVSAGQAPILLRRADGSALERDADIPPLAVDPVIPPPTVQTLDLRPGDTLLLLSDGFYEHPAPPPDNRPFGIPRALVAATAALASADPDPAAAILRAIASAVHAHGAGRPAADDQTAIILYRRV